METFTRWRTWDAAARDLPGGLAEALGPAARAAIGRHGGQLRPTGVPYQEHLLEALEVAVRGAGSTDTATLAAVLLHDVVEDTPATLDEVTASFGPEVAGLVGWVTKDPAGAAGPAAKRAAKTAYLERLRGAPPKAVLVKMCDRVSNVQRLYQMREDFARRYYAETVAHILPLAADLPFFADWFARWRRWYRWLGE